MTEDSTKRDSSAGFDRDPASESSTKEGPCVCTRPAPDLELFKRMTENAKDMIYRMSLPDGIYEYVSPASIEITGYSPEEFYANPLLIRSLMHPDWRGYFAREWERLLQGDVPPTYEYVILHKDGRERHINQRNVLVREENGTPVALEGILTDVTRNKQSEAALRRSEASYRSLYDSIMDGFVAVSIDGTVQQCNKAFLGMLGYDADEIRHLTYEDFTPEKWHAFERKIIETEVLERGYSDAYEKEYRRKDGTVFPVELRAYLMRDDAGKPAGMWGIVRDITERKKAEERLTRAHRRLENIIEFLPDATLIIDKDKKLIAWNRVIEEMTGVPKEEMLGKDHHEAAVPFYGFAGPYLVDYLDEGAGVDLPRYGNIKRKGDTLNAEAYAPALYNGKGAYIWAIASPLYDTDGSIIGIIESIRDITEQRRLAEERKKLETQLAQSQKMESIGTLAGGIAHDFNNILSAIFGFCELAMEDISEPEKAKSAIREIMKAGDRAKGLVRQILTFSRKTEISYSPVALRTVVKESLDMLRSVIPATVEIRQNLVDSGLVLSDPTQIHQILMNLSTNAVQAMDEAKGILSVRLQRVRLDETHARELDVEPGNYLKLAVQDNGRGIPPELRERIFEPYFTTKEPGRGTGLGLSVVHGIVKSHKGAIVCTGPVDGGATFETYLPEIESESLSAQPECKESLPTGTERILFVDDEASLAELAQKMLSRLGYQMTVRTSSVEALRFFQEDPGDFDLVITDMTMPVLSGDRFAEKIMRIRPDIPIILCTGYNENITEEKAKKIGIRAFLLKPLQLRELATTIRKVLDGTPTGSSLADDP